MLYLIIIAVSVVLITAANLLLTLPITLADLGCTAFSVILGAVAIFAIDGILALAIRRLTPKRWYAPTVRLFRVNKRERNFYRAIKIKSWKDKVPELGGFTDFHKNKLESNSDGAYLERFIIEANYGVVIHLANAVLGFLIMFIPFCAAPTVWMPIFAVNFLLSLLPVAVLRYTLYTLFNLYDRCQKRQLGKETI